MLGQIDELVQKITIKADTKALDVVQRKEKQLIATSSQLGAVMKSAFKWVGGTLFVKSIIDASTQMDSLNRSFNALAGSSKAGAEQIAYLRSEAMRLGQDFPTIANAYKNFFAVGRGAGMATGETQSIFSSILEASTVLGSNTQQVEGALLAIEQMISKGKVSMEELRRQLGNALPGAMQIAAKAMGTTSAEFEKLLSKGLPSLDFVRKFSAELRKTYSGDKLSGPVKSLRAELARLKNAWFFLRSDLLDGEAGKAFAEALREITKLLMSDGFKMALKVIAGTIALVLKNIKLIAWTFGLTKLFKIIGATQTFTRALNGFNKQLFYSKSLSLAFGGALKGMSRSMLLFAKSSLAVAKPLMVIAGILALIEDIWKTFTDKDADTFIKRRADELANFAEKHPVLGSLAMSAIPTSNIGTAMAEVNQNPWALNKYAGGMSGSMGAGEAEAIGLLAEQMYKKAHPQIVQNNYITTQSVDPNMLDERIKNQVRGVFQQSVLGGNK